MKTHKESFCRQVLEHHLIDDFVTAFDRVHVGTLNDYELLRIAAESHYASGRRNNLQAMRKALEKCLQEPRDGIPDFPDND